MSLAEFYNWEMFASMEPFLSERTDIAGAVVASTLANVNRGKNQKAYSIEDFMIVRHGLKEEEESVDPYRDAEEHFVRTMLIFGGVST